MTPQGERARTFDAPSAAGDACPGCGTLAELSERCAICGREAPDTRTGEVVGGKYRLESLLGAGGMGRVYRAEHLELGEPVAVKFLLAEWASRTEMRARFRREAVVLARLRHPNIVSVIDYGEHRGELYLVMEMLRGVSLDSQVKAGGSTLPLHRVVHVVDQVLQVLEAAHAAGVVHRDLKPENVMLLDAGDRTDRVKVLDFGIAMVDDGGPVEKLTATGTVRGTPHYMSPEQCVGRNVGPATDIYAVGAMLYELLTGATPFNGRSAAEIISQQMFATPPSFAERPPPREVPLGVEALVMRALAKKPEQRPTAAEFRDALQLCARGADDVTAAARDAAERARAAGLSRDDRAIDASPRAIAPETSASETGPSPRVALCGFGPERAAALRTAMAVHGMTAFPVAEAPPPMSPDKRPWKAVVVAGDAGAAEETRRIRAMPTLGTLPVIVLDLARAADAPALIRAGASDCALATVDDVAACQKVLRALRRGR
ncbi:MAG: serine/threonine-protein kinase [Polyangiales bacterium]